MSRISRHNLNKRQNFSNSTTCRCKLGFFQYIFYQYSIIWIQLIFYFLDLIIRWSILGSTFLPKSLYITGCFFCISRNICWGGEGVKMGQNENYTAFFCIDWRFWMQFWIEFWWERGSNGEKSQNSIKNCIKS